MDRYASRLTGYVCGVRFASVCVLKCMFAGILVGFFSHPFLSRADSHSPFHERAFVLTPRNLQIAQTSNEAISSAEYDLIPEIKIRTRVRGIGPVSLSFTTRKNLKWNATISRGREHVRDTKKPLLLQGKANVGSRGGKNRRLLAAAVIGNELKATFSHQTVMKRARLYTIRVKLDGSFSVSTKMTSVPERALAGMACGSDAALIGESFTSSGLPVAAQATGPLRVITISTEADVEWYTKYGEASNAQIAAIINAADVVYRNQLGISFQLVKQHVYTDPSLLTSLNPGQLLGQFTQSQDNATNLSLNPATFDSEVDIKHLFTGKDLEGSVVGIAFIGVACTAPEAAYGITQDYGPSVTWGIFAHEVGHNFGATHDISDRTSIMYPSISIPPSTTFSTFSHSEISQHLAAGGSCLDIIQGEIPALPTPTPIVTPEFPIFPTPEVPLPPPVPTETPSISIDPTDVVLSLTKQRIEESKRTFFRLSGRLRRSDGQPYSEVPLNLYAEGRAVGRTRTRSDGRYYFFVEVRVPLSEMLTAWVETQDGVAASNTVRLKRIVTRRIFRH